MKLKSVGARTVVIALVIAVVSPVTYSWANNRFPDVASNNAHHNNIEAIADAGVTLGCGDGNYCPDTLVRRDQMASFLARLGGLGRNARIANGRGDVSAYCAATANLPGRFPRGECARTSRVVEDSPSYAASYFSNGVSTAIGPDGLPVVTYLVRDPATENEAFVRIAHCDNLTCDSATTDDIGRAPVNTEVELAISADGNAIAFYMSTESGTMQLARCGLGCATVQHHNLPTEGSHPSLVVAPDGVAVVAYKLGSALFLSRCGQGCGTPVELGSAEGGDNGYYNSLAIGADGVPILSYHDGTTQDLEVVRCADAACSTGAESVAIATDGNVGNYSSIAVGIDGIPVISHLAYNNQVLLTRCADAACSAAQSTVLLYTFGYQGTSVALREDGIPVVAHRSQTAVLLSRCTTPSCAAVLPAQSIAGQGHFSLLGQNVDIAFGADGVPYVVYYDHLATNVVIVRAPTY